MHTANRISSEHMLAPGCTPAAPLDVRTNKRHSLTGCPAPTRVACIYQQCTWTPSVSEAATAVHLRHPRCVCPCSNRTAPGWLAVRSTVGQGGFIEAAGAPAYRWTQDGKSELGGGGWQPSLATRGAAAAYEAEAVVKPRGGPCEQQTQLGSVYRSAWPRVSALCGGAIDAAVVAMRSEDQSCTGGLWPGHAAIATGQLR